MSVYSYFEFKFRETIYNKMSAISKTLRLTRPVQAAISGATGAGRENEWLDTLMEVVPQRTLDSLVSHRGWHDKKDDLNRKCCCCSQTSSLLWCLQLSCNHRCNGSAHRKLYEFPQVHVCTLVGCTQCRLCYDVIALEEKIR